MNKRIIVILFVIILLMALAASWFLRPAKQEMMGLEPATTMLMLTDKDCDARGNTCEASLGRYKLRISMDPNVQTLQPFSLTVEADGWQPQQLAVYFSMQGMEMGLNRFRLVQTGNVWQGQAVLPVCTAQRSDWMASVFMSHKGQRYRAEFGFTNQ